MARPLGELHGLILERLRAVGPATARELAHGLQLDVQIACDYLHRMHRAGRVEVVGRVRVAHMKRPAVRYQVREPSDDAPAWRALAAWPLLARRD